MTFRFIDGDVEVGVMDGVPFAAWGIALSMSTVVEFNEDEETLLFERRGETGPPVRHVLWLGNQTQELFKVPS